MDILQLTYFKKVAECQNMTAAAKEMMVTTSSLCASIRRLEEDLGCRLFDRLGRRIQLNENGVVVLQHTKTILNSLEMIRKELRVKSTEKKQLNIGTTNRTYWVEALNKFAVRHPEINISCSILNKSEIENPYLCSQFDYIFSAASDFNQADWVKETLIQNDSPMLLVYAEHPLASRISVDLRETEHEPYIALDKKSLSRHFFDDLFQAAGFTPNVVINCDQLLRAPLIHSGYGIGITTKYGAQTEMLSKLRAVPISYPIYFREQALFHYKYRIPSDIEKEFSSFMIDYFKDV